MADGECSCSGYSPLFDPIEEPNESQGKSDGEWEREWSDMELAQAEEDVKAWIDSGMEPSTHDDSEEDRVSYDDELVPFACAALQSLLARLDSDELSSLSGNGPNAYLPLCRQAWHIALAMNQVRVQDPQNQTDGDGDLPF